MVKSFSFSLKLLFFLCALLFLGGMLIPEEEHLKHLEEECTVVENAAPSTYEHNEALEQLLKKRIAQNSYWKSLVDRKKMAIGLVDLRDESTSKYAYLNGREMMYAASLPKIAVLLAAADAIDKGEIKYEGAVKSDMKMMITKSNNQATTRMIDRLGFSKIKSVLTSGENMFYDKKKGGGLWVGKRYAAQGKRMPDPLRGLSHAATAEQVCRFYHKLYNDDLVSERGSAIMKSCLVDPQLHHKFVNSLDRLDPSAKVYRKSGTWKTYHADSALVLGEGDRKYILVALIDDENGGQICKDLVFAVEEVLGLSPNFLP